MGKRKNNGAAQANLPVSVNVDQRGGLIYTDDTAAGLRRAFQQRGIEWSGEFEAPEPPVVEAHDAKSLCVHPTTVKGAENQSKLCWLLSKPVLQVSTKEGAKSFMVAEVFVEDMGEIILTHLAERNNGTFSPLYEWLRDDVPVGGVFRFASFGTDRGYTVIRPVPVVA